MTLCIYPHQVKHLNFYDIVLDFILMDSFEDLENPPISIQNVINNRWLNSSFKETVSKGVKGSELKSLFWKPETNWRHFVYFNVPPPTWFILMYFAGSGIKLLVSAEAEEKTHEGTKQTAWRPTVQ